MSIMRISTQCSDSGINRTRFADRSSQLVPKGSSTEKVAQLRNRIVVFVVARFCSQNGHCRQEHFFYGSESRLRHVLMLRSVFICAIALQNKRANRTKLLISVLMYVRGHLPQAAIAARGAAEGLAVEHAEHHLDELVGQRLEEIAISTYHAERATREITHEAMRRLQGRW